MIRIFISGLPMPPNASRREHWSVRAEDSKAFREAAMLTAMTQVRLLKIPIPFDPAKVRYDFCLTERRGDLDGMIAACKPILDGLVDAKVLTDDRVGKLDHLEADWLLCSERGVWITVGKVGEDLGRVLT